MSVVLVCMYFFGKKTFLGLIFCGKVNAIFDFAFIGVTAIFQANAPQNGAFVDLTVL